MRNVYIKRILNIVLYFPLLIIFSIGMLIYPFYFYVRYGEFDEGLRIASDYFSNKMNNGFI